VHSGRDYCSRSLKALSDSSVFKVCLKLESAEKLGRLTVVNDGLIRLALLIMVRNKHYLCVSQPPAKFAQLMHQIPVMLRNKILHLVTAERVSRI